MIPVLRRFDHGQSSKLNCWSYKSADIDGMGHRHDPVDFCEWEIIFVGGEWGRGVHAGQSISGAYLLISQNISKYLGQEPNYVSIVSEFVVCMYYVYHALAFEQFFSNYLREIRDQHSSSSCSNLNFSGAAPF